MPQSRTEPGESVLSPRRIRSRLEHDHAYREYRIRAARQLETGATALVDEDQHAASLEPAYRRALSA